MSNALDWDTIAAVATAPGVGGIGIVRLSGVNSRLIAERICGHPLRDRQVVTTAFYNKQTEQAELIDQGVALYFAAPRSFTGEDVVELQAHGGPIVLDLLLRQCLALGARHARAGEFSERAYLNDKIDLVQAEAIADLINSRTEQEAKGALRSLQGRFSEQIDTLAEQLTRLRIYVEAALDFPEEEIDFLKDRELQTGLEELRTAYQTALHQAEQGTLLREGITIAIAGKPNAGKSSLLNALSGNEVAIVTPIAGTTRDLLKESINIDGLHAQLIDTAGLRESDDVIEQEGVRRAKAAVAKADLILLVRDAASEGTAPVAPASWSDALGLPDTPQAKLLCVDNKCDLLDKDVVSALPVDRAARDRLNDYCAVSAKTGFGLPALRETIKRMVGMDVQLPSPLLARRRHLNALGESLSLIERGQQQLLEHGAGELLAEDLRQAQNVLGEITGRISSDELLGEIFSSFCIGK